MSRRLAPGFDHRLDQVLQGALDNDTLNIPGFVAMARRGGSVYGPKAFGMADVAAGRPMAADAMMRMYSMTKVLTSTVALMLYDRGLFKLNDPVGRFLPAFDRQWLVVREAQEAADPAIGGIEIRSLQTGMSSPIRYAASPAVNVMRIKHLMSETSGIGYEIWSDFDAALGGALGTRRSFQIANALRARICPTVYTSSCILGHDLGLAEFCDVIAEAGVLATEPGQFSYGLGASVLGRIIEIVHERASGKAMVLSEIFREMLFKPLGMQDAAFFLPDGDPRVERVPALYGVRVDDESRHAAVPAEQSIPPTDPPYSNGTDHFSGPRAYESGDTGTIMPVADYARFLDFVARGGVTEDGERLLSLAGVDALTRRWVSGLDLDTGLARFMNCAGPHNENVPSSFQFGWEISRPGLWHEEHDAAAYPGTCSWGGYAHTSVTYYPGEESWLILAPQAMAHGGTGADRIGKVLTGPALAAFLDLWR